MLNYKQNIGSAIGIGFICIHQYWISVLTKNPYRYISNYVNIWYQIVNVYSLVSAVFEARLAHNESCVFWDYRFTSCLHIRTYNCSSTQVYKMHGYKLKCPFTIKGFVTLKVQLTVKFRIRVENGLGDLEDSDHFGHLIGRVGLIITN